MVSQCVNPECGKPLHYLRDGKVFLFSVESQDETARTEHFWLCGDCSARYVIKQVGSAVQVEPKFRSRRPAVVSPAVGIAS